MAYETILVDEEGHVRTITLNRPGDLNALNERMTSELQAALAGVAGDRSVRCLVLTGAGRAFCAGQDLKEVTGSPEPVDYTEIIHRRYNPIVRHFRSLGIPVMASINGVAAGAGWSLALACDLRIASKTAKFVSAFGRIGLVPDAGMTWTLPRLVGLPKALEIAWFSDPISAEEALQLRLVNRLAEPDELAAATRAWAATLAQAAPESLALTKQAINESLVRDLESQLECEARLQGIAGRTKDYLEGVQAFIEKRTPEFTGEQ
jgi:2-(1,2-epoxy-1,2-dihydrophenyl)acetyl-CoA isomerase